MRLPATTIQPVRLWPRAEKLAYRLRVSRSQLYAQAIEEYLGKRQDSLVTERLNAVYAAGQAPGNVRIAKSDSGLPQPSVVNVSQLITLDRSMLTSKVKTLPGAVMDKVDSGLKLVLALP